ncbi:MAG: hypothetical protein CL947_02955 [Epsilonproteobacteria bacterium]|nr:hypothetical protein [Campylobacterota bacterium]
MFEDMMKQIRIDIVRHVFHLKPEQFNTADLEQKRQQEMDAMQMVSAHDNKSDKSDQAKREEDKVGRNERCSCGSGKKFKKCCGA